MHFPYKTNFVKYGIVTRIFSIYFWMQENVGIPEKITAISLL